MEMKEESECKWIKKNQFERSSGDSRQGQGRISLFRSPTKVKDPVLDLLISPDAHLGRLIYNHIFKVTKFTVIEALLRF